MIDFAKECACLHEAGRLIETERINIAIDDADCIMLRGLRYFIGDKAQWLPEYTGVAAWMKNNDGRGLLCAGSIGRGKTILCGKVLPCILHYHAGKIVTGYTARELAAHYDEAINRKLLFIDDIGTESQAVIYGTRIDAVPALVDEAERRGNMLLLTTNLTFAELSAKYGERTVDRLRGICRVVIFQGESMRGKPL